MDFLQLSGYVIEGVSEVWSSYLEIDQAQLALQLGQTSAQAQTTQAQMNLQGKIITAVIIGLAVVAGVFIFTRKR